MWTFDELCGYCSYPIFLAVAWLRASRQLSRKLSYKLPVAFQWKLPVFRAFWACDLMIGSVVFLFAMQLLKPFSGQLVEGLPAFVGDASYSRTLLPVLALVLGFAWPELASTSLRLGWGGRELGVESLRNYVLNGPALESIQRKLDVVVSSYIERVSAYVQSDLEQTGARIAKALDLDLTSEELRGPEAAGDLTAALQRLARKDLAQLSIRVGNVRMIPLVERPKPLMRIPDMTAREEEQLHESGFSTPRKLARMRASDVAGIDEKRLQVLRENARRLIKHRARALGLVCASAAFVGILGVAYARLFLEQIPPSGVQRPAPAGLSSPTPEAYSGSPSGEPASSAKDPSQRKEGGP